MMRAYPRVLLSQDEKTKKQAPIFVYPEEVLNIRTKDGLRNTLEQYHNVLPMIDGSTLNRSRDSLRHIVEWVFPTLRWYCKAYNLEIPVWLKGNHWADLLSPEERKRFLGSRPLKVVEWQQQQEHQEAEV